MSGDGGRGGGGGREEANVNAGNEAKDDEEEEEEDVNANGMIGGGRGGKVAEAAAKEDKFAFQTFVGNGGLACEDFNDLIFKKTRYITKSELEKITKSILPQFRLIISICFCYSCLTKAQNPSWFILFCQ